MTNINVNTNIELLETIVEEVNYVFEGACKARLTRKGNIQLICGKRGYSNEYELEEKVQRVIEYLVYKFNVDFMVEDYYQNSIIYSVIEF